MFHANIHPDHRQPLTPADAAMLGQEAAADVERHLHYRQNSGETPLVSLSGWLRQRGSPRST